MLKTKIDSVLKHLENNLTNELEDNFFSSITEIYNIFEIDLAALNLEQFNVDKEFLKIIYIIVLNSQIDRMLSPVEYERFEKEFELINKILNDICYEIINKMPYQKRIELVRKMDKSYTEEECITTKMLIVTTLSNQDKRVYVEDLFLDFKPRQRAEIILSMDLTEDELFTYLMNSEILSDDISQNMILEKITRVSLKLKFLEQVKDIDPTFAFMIIESMVENLSDIDIVEIIQNPKIIRGNIKLQVRLLALIRDDKTAIETVDKIDIEDKVSQKTKLVKTKSTAERLIKEQKLSPFQTLMAISGVSDKEDIKALIEKYTKLFELIDKLNKFEVFELELPENLTIGIELEASGLPFDRTERLFNVLCDDWEKGWIKKEDGSIKPQGTEITSPILHGNIKDMKQLLMVTSIMQLLQFRSNDSCGGHIHYGVNILNSKNGIRAGITTLLTIWKECEELIFKISNPVGSVLRPDVAKFAKPISHMIPDNLEELSDKEFEDLLKKLGKEKYSSLNFSHLKPNDIQTIEFRISNSEMKFIELVENILFNGKLMEKSGISASEPEKMRNKISRIKNKNISEAEKLECLLSLLFDSEFVKNIYRKRWEFSKSQDYSFLGIEETNYKRGDYSISAEAEQFYNEVDSKDILFFTRMVKQTLDNEKLEDILNSDILK